MLAHRATIRAASTLALVLLASCVLVPLARHPGRPDRPARRAGLSAWPLSPAQRRLWQRAKRSNELRDVRPMRLFHWSNMYLSLLFVAVALDPMIKR